MPADSMGAARPRLPPCQQCPSRAEEPGRSGEWAVRREWGWRGGREVAGPAAGSRQAWIHIYDSYLLFIAFWNKAWQGSAWELVV